MIQFESVSLRYPNGTTALRSVDLMIEKGEFVFLVGPSGMGKSSLLKMVYREVKPTEGRVLVGGRDVSQLSRSQIPLLRRTVGVIFQDFRLLPQKTVAENVGFALDVIGCPKREKFRRVPKVLDLVGLSTKADVYPDELSGGEQQRVSIARALVNNPPILLADEPTGNLDPATSWTIMELLAKINVKGTTVAVATHDREVVDRMNRRVVTMENGVIASDRLRGAYQDEPEISRVPSR